jgi:hypothetical protein
VSLHNLLQIPSLTLLEKLPLQQTVAGIVAVTEETILHSQLKLFEF